MRVYELARELGIPSKELVAKLKAMGVAVKSHMSSVEPDVAEKFRGGETAAPAAETPAESAPAAAEESPAEAAPAEETKPEAPAEPAPEPEPEPQPEPEPEKPRVPLGGIIEDVPPSPTIKVHGPVTVKQLASKLGLRPNILVSELMRMNIFASINQKVDVETAKKLCVRHGFMLEVEKRPEPRKPIIKKPTIEEEIEEDRPEDLLPRSPVVTFLGHVDHGKTSLLDRVRDTMVTEGEAGGITQHIGAYTIDRDGRKITFLDTPGHAAFTAMRARGANLTDIAVIIIAADDGVMPQTREAIRHARAAGVCVMVAINKTDLPGANVDQVKQQLLGEDLTPEDWGGDTICVPVSAQTGEGIDDLLEMILLQSEVLELTANPNRQANGFVVESRLEQGMGPTAHLLVKNGTLKVGDAVLCGPHWGRIRALVNDHGLKVKSAGPSTPVKCLGLSGVPDAGAQFRVLKNEKLAKRAASDEQARVKEGELQQGARKTSLDDLFDQIEDSRKLELRLVLKGDTQGSVEAIQQSLMDINSDKVSLNILLADTGNITVNDIMLASASDAVVVGFHVGKESSVPAASKHEGVETHLFTIIYELLERVEQAMTGLLAPKQEERARGRAEVRKVFEIGKTGTVAGCMVIKGRIRPAFRARLLRGGDVLYEGAIASLKHFQDEVSEVREAQECGVRLDNYSDLAEGDILEFYEIEEVTQTL